MSLSEGQITFPTYSMLNRGEGPPKRKISPNSGVDFRSKGVTSENPVSSFSSLTESLGLLTEGSLCLQ